MSRLIESIRLENGVFNNLSWHQRRIDYSLASLYQAYQKIELVDILNRSSFPGEGLFKCRVVYDHKTYFIEYENYTIRPVNSLRIVTDNEVEYAFKFRDRTKLNESFSKRAGCDDVLIIKNGFVTDTSYANILFKRDNDWITPTNCLLNGTTRQRLLQEGTIKEEPISLNAISSFKKFKLINALLLWDSPEVDISNIV